MPTLLTEHIKTYLDFLNFNFFNVKSVFGNFKATEGKTVIDEVTRYITWKSIHTQASVRVIVF